MRTIRASEIGTYLYCRRSWWYQIQGVTSKNQAELAEGNVFHRRHGRKVIRTGLLRFAATLALLAAILLMAAALALQLVSH